MILINAPIDFKINRIIVSYNNLTLSKWECVLFAF